MRAYAFIPFPLLLCGCVVPQPASTPAPSAAPSSAQRIVERTVASGERQRIDFFVFLNPDCTSGGYVTVRIVTPPAHGELTTDRGVDYSNYPKENQRYQCNLKKSPVTNIYYKSNSGYIGMDSVLIEDVSALGIARSNSYTITVK